MANSEDAKQVRAIAVPITWQHDDCPVAFANQMLVTTDGHECHFCFYEIVPPIQLEGSELPTSVTAKRVARVVISRTRLARFVEALNEVQNRLEIADAKRKEPEEKEE